MLPRMHAQNFKFALFNVKFFAQYFFPILAQNRWWKQPNQIPAM